MNMRKTCRFVYKNSFLCNNNHCFKNLVLYINCEITIITKVINFLKNLLHPGGF